MSNTPQREVRQRRWGVRRSVLALTVVGLLSAGLAACQTGDTAVPSATKNATVKLPPLSDLTPLADPTAYEGSTTAVVGGPSLEPFAEAPQSKLPTTVVSKDKAGDKKITVDDNSRVLALSLSGTLGELVYAYGMSDHLVGRDISTDFEGAKALPIITREGHSINAEAVLALDPTLIVTDGSIGPSDVVLQLRDAGIPVVTVDRAIDPESSYVTAQQLADALGIGDAAPTLIDQLKHAIAEKEREVSALLPQDDANLPRVAFLYVRGTAGIFYLFGEGSGADGIVRSLGAIDVAQEAGWQGERPMTEEALITMDPDVILVMTKGLESAGGVDGLLAAQPSIALTNAGEHRRIIDVDDGVLFAGGIRIPDVIDGLARAIYAPDSLK